MQGHRTGKVANGMHDHDRWTGLDNGCDQPGQTCAPSEDALYDDRALQAMPVILNFIPSVDSA